MMIEIKKYSPEDKKMWNDFNNKSKNSIFMFDRKYMDYHSDRFVDSSMMFYQEDELVAILPMNIKGDILFSHGGLTYGGFIINSNMHQHIMNECFNSLIRYSKENKIKKIIYKTMPYIFYKQPSEEDRYALFVNGARLLNVDVSTYLNLKTQLKMSKGRKSQISKAKREGVIIKELFNEKDFINFIDLENSVLSKRHNTNAVHTGKELSCLHEKFIDCIHLFGAFKNDVLIAGTVIYEYDDVIHTQYMAANDEARVVGALDLAINYVIERYKNKKTWLDFGISNEHGKDYLNEGLLHQKESFGGRTGVYETWELKI